jgi:phosphoribosylamine--glycine ligase
VATVLVVGRGGREHVISKQFLKSKQVTTVYCAPGNPGMLQDKIHLVPIDELAFPELIAFAQQQQIDLTFVGPEVPLQQGIVDAFQAAGLTIFGPDQAAAQLEGSKTFAKKIMAQANVATAAYTSYTDEAAAIAALDQQTFPVVLKANGLAAGKGVVIAQNRAAAVTALHEFLGQHRFDTTTVVMEEFLVGEEFSLMAFVSGDQVVPMPLAQDHKAAFDGDQGPNTGGMGAYSPLPQMPPELAEQGLQQVLKPVVKAMHAVGCSFTGILYAGLIKTATGIKVIEFNVRFGDPETQVVLPQLQTDFYQLLQDLLEQRSVTVGWQSEQTYLGVVVADEQYPMSSGAGHDLTAFQQLPAGLICDYAGTKQDAGKLVSSGGRILCVVTAAVSIQAAQTTIYTWLQQQNLSGLRYRSDIGHRAIDAEA